MISVIRNSWESAVWHAHCICIQYHW